MDVETAARQALEGLLHVWENGAGDLNRVVDPEPYAHFSMMGTVYTQRELVGFLAARAMPCSLELHLINHVVRSDGDTAYQYATIVGLFTGAGMPQRHLAFGGSFANRLVHDGDTWKLKVIRFDLQCEDSVGRTSLSQTGMLYRASGFGFPGLISMWKAVDDRVGHNMAPIPGMGERMINQDYDAPWYAVPDAEATRAKEDDAAVRELLYRYCFAYDFAALKLVDDIFADEVAFSCQEAAWGTKRDVIGFLKLHRKSTPRSHHSVVFDEVSIEGDRAIACAHRIAPDLQTRSVVVAGIDQWADGSYRYEARKEQGSWRIAKFDYSGSMATGEAAR